MAEEPKQVSTEELFGNLFGASASGTGEEELLRIAAKYSLQLDGRQIQCLSKIELIIAEKPDSQTSITLRKFVEAWLEYKQHHKSGLYVMEALDSIALRRFITSEAFKVNVQKN